MEKTLENINTLKIRIASNENVTEEDLRQAMNEDIKNYLKDNYNMDISFKNEVLTASNTFIDSKYGNFIIEYKRPSKTLSEHDENQLIEYLKSIGNDSWGILTNGKEMKIYNYSYINKKFELDDKYSNNINEEQFIYIANIISNKDNKILTKNNINEIFGAITHKQIIKRIYSLIKESKNPRTKLLYNEWQKLFHISDAKDKFDKNKKKEIIDYYELLLDVSIESNIDMNSALFSIQTYYAIVLKLILYKLILNKTKSKVSKPKILKDLFESIENNRFFRKNNIVNLVDGDFFSWYLNEFEKNDFDYFYDLITDIATIKETKINFLFITFYENIFPFHVRHSMGEYYTPEYLAKDIIENTIDTFKEINGNEINPTILDPTCGSGIFILKSMDYTENKIYGIDINPLSVLTAKINYVINNFNLNSMLEIPIYLGDSTYLPIITNINGVECYEYELITSINDFPYMPFKFPTKLINEVNLFQILDEMEMYVRKLDKKSIINLMISYKSFEYNKMSNVYDVFIENLFNLEKQGMNSIWLKIIGNYLKAGSIRNIDCIVGNPPWVKWSNLPENYKENIKNKCRIDGVFSKDTNSGGVDLNISALIAHVSIRDRLTKNGVLGFIMPDSILFNKSFEGFREMLLNNNERFYLNKVVRWNNKSEKPFDPVSISFAEYYFSFKKINNEVKIFDRNEMINKKAFKIESGFNNHYLICNEDEYSEIQEIIGNNNLKFRSGIGLIKGGHYLLKFSKNIDESYAEFFVYETINRRLRVSSKKIIIEKEIVYPYVKSEMVNDNEIKKTDYYCIFPFPFGSKRPYELNEIRELFPKFYNYYMSEEVQESISSSSSYNDRIQKNDFNVGIFRVGEYTYSDNFLITRDNTKSVFATVSKLETHWNEMKMPIFDGHINYVTFDEDYSLLTQKRSKELFDIFTKNGVKLFIKYSSDSRSISSRLYNDIKLK